MEMTHQWMYQALLMSLLKNGELNGYNLIRTSHYTIESKKTKI